MKTFALRSRQRRLVIFVQLVVAFSAMHLRASQPDDERRATARRLAYEGMEHLEAGRWDRAQETLALAYRFVPAPTIAVLEGRALEKLGKLLEAEQRYLAASRAELAGDAPPAFHQAVTEAGDRLSRVREAIPTLEIRVVAPAQDTDSVDVRMNGRHVPVALLGVPQPVNPGHYVLKASFAAGVTTERLNLMERQHRSVELKFLPPVAHVGPPWADSDSRSSPDLQSLMGKISLGVGGAGLTVGIVSGIVALDKKSQLDERCTDKRCPPNLHDDLDAFRTARTVSTVGYSVGAAGIGAGVILLLTNSPEEQPKVGKVRVEPWLGHNIGGVKGRF